MSAYSSVERGAHIQTHASEYKGSAHINVHVENWDCAVSLAVYAYLFSLVLLLAKTQNKTKTKTHTKHRARRRSSHDFAQFVTPLQGHLHLQSKHILFLQ